MTKLNDTQTILLSTASQREDGSLFPLPETLKGGARVDKALAALLGAHLAEERETDDPAAAHRPEGDLHYGVFVTPAGLGAIGIGQDEGTGGAGEDTSQPAAPVQPDPAPARVSKSAAVVALLQREAGATLPEMIAATGWLPHTTRAALTGLRKKGHVLEKSKRDEATCYRIASVG